MKKAILAALLGAALLTGTAGAVVDPPENTYVADYADVLTADTEQYIIAHNQTLNAATGGAIEVVTVDFLDGMDIADYAYELFNSWGIGDGEADNGLLLLLAIGEENYYAMPGAGIEDALTAATLDDYLWTYLEADFAAGDYDAGVRQVFDAFYGWYESYYGGFAQGTVPPAGAGLWVSAPAGARRGPGRPGLHPGGLPVPGPAAPAGHPHRGGGAGGQLAVSPLPPALHDARHAAPALCVPALHLRPAPPAPPAPAPQGAPPAHGRRVRRLRRRHDPGGRRGPARLLRRRLPLRGVPGRLRGRTLPGRRRGPETVGGRSPSFGVAIRMPWPGKTDSHEKGPLRRPFFSE